MYVAKTPLEIYVASRMQNMVHIRKRNTYFVTNLLFRMFWKSSLGALGVESPYGGAIPLFETILPWELSLVSLPVL